jgi:hypothetical protein
MAESAPATGPTIIPVMSFGGHLSLVTDAGGVAFTSFNSQPCKQLTIVNDTGVDLEVQVGGVGQALPVFTRTPYTFFGLTNSSNLGVRRVDQNVTQVTVKARYEG